MAPEDNKKNLVENPTKKAGVLKLLGNEASSKVHTLIITFDNLLDVLSLHKHTYRQWTQTTEVQHKQKLYQKLPSTALTYT
jgi:hypothetical protein